MKKTVLVWASVTGNTRKAADLIADAIGREHLDIFEITDRALSRLLDYETIIAGTPTWGTGDLQDDWQSVFSGLDNLDFTGKTLAFFGLGDQLSYGDWYLDAMGILSDKFIERGAIVVGRWPAESYEFSASKACTGDSFIGLALDDDNQAHLTAERIRLWVEDIRQYCR